jgi:RecQ mediated genome instability protein
MNTVDTILKKLYIKDYVQKEWLEDCVEYCRETGDFAEEFRKQLLFSDLEDYAIESDHIGDEVNFSFFQIMQIEDIGFSKSAIIESLTDKDLKSIPRSMLKLTLMSAGKRLVEMIELDPIKGLDLLTPLGAKIIIKYGVFKKNVLIVKGQDVIVLGGEVEDLNPVEPRIRVLTSCREALGMKMIVDERENIPRRNQPLQQLPVVRRVPDHVPIRDTQRETQYQDRNSNDHQRQTQARESQYRNQTTVQQTRPQHTLPNIHNSPIPQIPANSSTPVDVNKLRELFAFRGQTTQPAVPVKAELPYLNSDFDKYSNFDDYPIDDKDLDLENYYPNTTIEVKEEDVEVESEEDYQFPDSPDLANEEYDDEADEAVKEEVKNEIVDPLDSPDSLGSPPAPASVVNPKIELITVTSTKRRCNPLQISSPLSSPPTKKISKSSKPIITISSSSPDLERQESLGDMILSSVVKCKDFRAIKANKEPNVYSVRCKIFDYAKLGIDYAQNLVLMDQLGNILNVILDPICVKELFDGISFEELQLLKENNLKEAKRLAIAYFKKLKEFEGDLTIDVFDQSMRVISMS